MYCEYYRCAPEDFVRDALFRCLYRHAVLFFRLFYWMRPRTVLDSMRFIEKVGQTRTREDLEDIISEYHNDMADTATALSRQWKMRVSSRAVAMLNEKLRGRPPGKESASSASD